MNENENLEPVGKLTPFTKMVMSIGTLPSSFYASMSYYESMVWLYEYLKNQVIPTVNGNAAAVEELQEKYIEFSSGITEEVTDFKSYINGKVDELETYMNNYFNNLDVQQEINNKLDAMALNGTLTNLIKAYIDPIYSSYETSINQAIEEQNDTLETIETKVDSLSSGGPKGTYATVSALTAADPNHSNIYLVSADGKWYYYNTSTTSWTAGGTYQTSGIAEKGVTILNLDDPLQSNFNKSFSNPITPTNYTTGFYKVSTNAVVQETDAAFKCFSVNLDINKIYSYSGYNYGNSCALILTNGSDEIIYNSNTTISMTPSNVSKIFIVNESGITAYISIRDSAYMLDKTIFRVLNNTYNNLKIKTTTSSIRTISNVFINYTQTAANNDLRFGEGSGYATDIYEMAKGVTYKITYKGFSTDARGYCITNLDNTPIDIMSTADAGTKTFTAETDGYIYLTNNTTYVVGTLEIINQAIDVTYPDTNISILKDKKIAYEGDSIAESRLSGTSANGGAYAKIIADNTGCTYVNNAIGGGRLSSTIGLSPARHSVVDSIAQLPSDADLYCIEGGVNDYFNGVPLGTFDPEDYTSTPDITTVGGALEQIFKFLLTTYVGKPVIFVIIHKLADPFIEHGGYDFPTLRQRLIDVCKKYSIPYYDAYNDSGLNGMLTAQQNAFLNASGSGTPDGTHPNADGYKIYYVPQLTKLMESVMPIN